LPWKSSWSANPSSVLLEKAVASVLRTIRSLSSPRTLLRLAGAAVVGVAATAMFAAPASAWNAQIEGNPVCDAETGTVTVSWSIRNQERKEATFTVDEFRPEGSEIDNETGTLPGDTWTPNAVTQTNVPGNTRASIKVTVVWKHGDQVLDTLTITGHVGKTQCVKPSPSESPSASPSGGGGGGEGTPTPSTSTAPSLPVTGPNAAIYGGGAAGLLAIGATLFVVARRRRIRFEA
jgi:hypothetical protein